MDGNDIFIFSVMILSGAFFVGLLGYWLWRAWNSSDESISFWRGVKLASASCGAIGVIIFILNFEQLTRETMRVNAYAYGLAELLDTKSLLQERMWPICIESFRSEQKRQTCGDLQNIIVRFQVGLFNQGAPISSISNWMKNRELDPFVEFFNPRIELLNGISKRIQRGSMVSFENRVKIQFIAIVFLVVAAAGSVGEAAFQCKQSGERRHAHKEVVKPKRRSGRTSKRKR